MSDLRLLLYFEDDDERALSEITMQRFTKYDFLALCQDDQIDLTQVRDTYVPHVVFAFSNAANDIPEIFEPFIGHTPIFVLVHFRDHLPFVREKYAAYLDFVEDVVPLPYPLHPTDIPRILKKLLADIGEI